MRHSLLTAIVTLLLFLAIPSAASAAQAMTWIVDAESASTFVANGATLLDARSKWSYSKGHLEGAVHIAWDDFTPSKKSNKGQLLRSNEKLAKLLAEHGIEDGRPVIVVDDPKDGWGEAGRIVWMLRSLGHERSAWVDGGHEAMKKAGHDTTLLPSKARKSSGVTIKRNDRYAAPIDEVKASLGSAETTFVDTREEREYDGKTPYGESRGGHLPDARHLWYKDLLDKDGYLKSKSELRELLKKRGISPDKPVVAYCTGGVRSGWFVGVLRHIGYTKAKNYAGSMWEWSSKPESEFPLE